MRHLPFNAVLVLCSSLIVQAAGLPGAHTQLPLVFEENLGQSAPPVKFLARAPGHSVFFTSSEVVLAVHGENAEAALGLRFTGTKGGFKLSASGLLPGKNNYFIGRNPDAWHTGMPTYSRLYSSEIYQGVDVVFHGNQGRLEYDFILKPGADSSQIGLQFDGAESITVDEAGDLVIDTPAGAIKQHRPVAYQMIDGRRHSVEASYGLLESGDITLRIGPYDETRELVVDPVVSFATFLGSSGYDDGRGIAVDGNGHVYVTGNTHSADFPVKTGAYDITYQDDVLPGDAFVTCLEPDGSTIRHSTYIGGTSEDAATSITVDNQGYAYIAGYTYSTEDFPASELAYQGFQQSAGTKPDGFVAKLSPSGGGLEYATYLGGNYTDRINALAVDAAGNAYVAGATDSTTFPVTQSAYQGACPGLGFSGFVTKLSVFGNTVHYSTLLCGSSSDEITGIAVDTQGNAYVTGVTRSSDFPTTVGALRTEGGGDNDEAFIAKLNPTGAALAYSTYLGGSAADGATGITLDNEGNAYVSGYTRSTDFPVTDGAFQTFHADNGLYDDAFLAVLDSAGEQLLQSTYLGGSAADRALGIALGSGGIQLTGYTASYDFPVIPATCQTGFGGLQDAFITGLNAAGSALNYSLFLGGRENDLGQAVAAGPDGIAYVTGRTNTRRFPTTLAAFRTAYEAGYSGASDAFVVKVDSLASQSPPCIALNGLVNSASYVPEPVAPGEIISVFGDGLGPDTLAIFQLNGGDMVSRELAGVRVLFDDEPAAIIAAWRWQVNAIAPYVLAGKTSTVVKVEYLGQTTAEFTVPVAESSPAIFTLDSSGRGPGVILNQDNSVNTPANPAVKDSIIQIFATGEGQTIPSGVDGKIATAILPVPILDVSVTIGGLESIASYASGASGMVAGVVRVTATIPPDVSSGSAVPIVLKIGEATSPPGVTLAIE